MIRCISATLFAAVLFSPDPALAQDIGGARALIPMHATISVLDKQGTEHRGRFLRFDGQDLIMVVGIDERRFSRDGISRIERLGDSLKNGALVGAIVGGLLGVLGAVLQAEDVGQGIAAIAISTGFYTAVGTGLDAAVRGRTLVYQDWPASPGPRRAAALTVTVKW